MAASRIQLLLPAATRWPRPLPDAISSALGRADRVEAASAGLPQVPASAALSRLGEGDLTIDEVLAQAWLRVDPAWIRADINGARLFAVGAMLPLDADDIDAFAPLVQSLCDEAGFMLDIAHPQRWYLRLPRDTTLPAFSTPIDALGEDVFDHRPEGDAARSWRVLDNEVQVALHQHPRNEARQRTGQPPVNAMWWWGEAALPDAPVTVPPTIHSDDPLLCGLARLANMTPAGLPEAWPADAQGLYDLRGVHPERLAHGWLLPALQWMAKGSRDMHWLLEDGPNWHLSRAQGWRFWRAPRDAEGNKVHKQ